MLKFKAIKMNYKLSLLTVIAVLTLGFALFGGTGVTATFDGDILDPIAATDYLVKVGVTNPAGGTVTVNGQTLTDAGMSLPITSTNLAIVVTPSAGYEISAATPPTAVQSGSAATLTGTAGTYAFTADGSVNDVNISVTFTKKTYTFTVKGSEASPVGAPVTLAGGTVETTTASPVEFGAAMAFTVKTKPTNSAFGCLIIAPADTAGTPPAPYNTALNFTAPSYNFTVTPVFYPVPTASITLKATGENGATGPAPTLAPVAQGETAIDLKAVAQGTTITLLVTEPATGAVFNSISATRGHGSLDRVAYDRATRTRTFEYTVPTDIDDKTAITITVNYGKTFGIAISQLPLDLGGAVDVGSGIITIAGANSAAPTYSCRYNDYAEFYVIPDANYKIKNVDIKGAPYAYHGNGYYVVGPIAADVTLAATFVSLADGVIDSSVDKSGPRINVKSIADIYDQLYDFQGKPRNEGATICAPADSTAMINSSLFDSIRGRNVNIIIKGKTYEWTFNGKRVAPKENVLSSSNLDVKIEAYVPPVVVTSVTKKTPSKGTTVTTEEPIDTGLIPEKYMKQLRKYPNMYMVDVAYDGVLPFTGKLSLNVDKVNAGQFGNLYFFNEKTHEFEAKGSCPVDIEGDVGFEFNHASRYIVVVSNRVLSSLDIVKGAGIFERDNLIEGIDNTQLGIAAGIFGIVILVGIILMRVIKRANRDD